MIERKPAREDKRVKLLYLTKAGAATLREIMPSVERAQARMLQPLKPADRKTLLALMTQLVDLNNEASRVPLRAEDALEHLGKAGDVTRRPGQAKRDRLDRPLGAFRAEAGIRTPRHYLPFKVNSRPRHTGSPAFAGTTASVATAFTHILINACRSILPVPVFGSSSMKRHLARIFVGQQLAP